jgi:hypothetical protein
LAHPERRFACRCALSSLKHSVPAIGSAAYIGLNDSFERSGRRLARTRSLLSTMSASIPDPPRPNGSTATMTTGLGPRCLKREFEPRAECGIPPAWLRPPARCRHCGHDFPIASSWSRFETICYLGIPGVVYSNGQLYIRQAVSTAQYASLIDIKKDSRIRYSGCGYVTSFLILAPVFCLHQARLMRSPRQPTCFD